LDLIEIGYDENKFFEQIIVKMQIGTAKRQSTTDSPTHELRGQVLLYDQCAERPTGYRHVPFHATLKSPVRLTARGSCGRETPATQHRVTPRHSR